MVAPVHLVLTDPPGIADDLKVDSQPVIDRQPLGLNPTNGPDVENLDTFGRIVGQGT